MAERIEFGSVLEGKGSEGKLWLIIIPAILAVFVLAGWGMMRVSEAGALKRDAAAAQAQAAELQKTIEQRDKLLVDARAEEAVQRSPGAAVAIFYGSSPDARESGVAFAHPAESAVRVYLYGLTAPPEGQEYVVAARTKSGETKALGAVIPGSDGTGFVLGRDVPGGTTAIELLLRPHGQESLAEAKPRVAARWPENGERGVLTEATQATKAARPAQARQGRSPHG